MGAPAQTWQAEVVMLTK
jgi:hypothetical protein